MSANDSPIQDALYGPIRLPNEIVQLAGAPIVQRLRHVRLSNIDSFDMPGIANLSRFEHVLGVAYLASEIGLRRRISTRDHLTLQAAALLHDWAITSFGHLVEEALQYAGTGFDHEMRLAQIVAGEAPEEIGGVQRQIIRGRETGLRRWAAKVSESYDAADNLITEITSEIRGKGKFGKIISGTIDLDNSDNLFRVAYHMGLSIDRETPLRIARAIVDVEASSGELIFSDAAHDDIEAWCRTRREVYERLMLARQDFAAKVMILFAAVSSIEAREITTAEWALNDYDFVERLLASQIDDVRDTAERWIAGELWNITPLMWLSGSRPPYVKMREFSKAISDEFGRQCFGYAIKDKRHRKLNVKFQSGATQEFDKDENQWVLGVGSIKRQNFSPSEVKKIFDSAVHFFGSSILGPALQSPTNDKQPWLL